VCVSKAERGSAGAIGWADEAELAVEGEDVFVRARMAALAEERARGTCDSIVWRSRMRVAGVWVLSTDE
jgi:hypothetical protein